MVPCKALPFGQRTRRALYHHLLLIYSVRAATFDPRREATPQVVGVVTRVEVTQLSIVIPCCRVPGSIRFFNV